MNLYIKIPVELLEESPIIVWHYCHLYRDLLSLRKINLKQYATTNKISYQTCRRLLKIAKQQRSKS